MDKLTAIFKALSDRNRLRIVSALIKNDELCACQLAELIQATGATVSHHTGILVSSGLVGSRKDGRWVYYRIRRDQADLNELIGWIKLQLSKDTDTALGAAALDGITS